MLVTPWLKLGSTSPSMQPHRTLGPSRSIQFSTNNNKVGGSSGGARPSAGRPKKERYDRMAYVTHRLRCRLKSTQIISLITTYRKTKIDPGSLMLPTSCHPQDPSNPSTTTPEYFKTTTGQRSNTYSPDPSHTQ